MIVRGAEFPVRQVLPDTAKETLQRHLSCNQSLHIRGTRWTSFPCGDELPMEDIFHGGEGGLRSWRVLANGEFGPPDNHLGIHPLGLTPLLHVIDIHIVPYR